MKKQLLATAVLAALSLNVAHAYQAELNAGAGYANVNSTPDDATAFSLGASITGYLEPVRTQNGPVAEAGFINHASNATLNYNYTQAQQSGFDDSKINTVGIDAEYYVPQSILYLSVNGAHSEENTTSTDVTTYGAEIGVLPIPNLLVALGVAVVDTDVHTDTDPTIRAKWLTQLASGNSVNLEGHARFGENSDAWGVKGDFYLDRTFSIGLGYDSQTVKGADDPYTVNLNARKFITPVFGVGASVYTGKTFGEDTYGVGINGTWRF